MSQTSIIMARNGEDTTFEYVTCDEQGKLSVNLTGQNVDVISYGLDPSGNKQSFLVDEQHKLLIKGAVDISGQQVDISGQRVVTDISGQRVDISGQTVVVTGLTFDTTELNVDISGQRVDISGQTLIVNTISGYTLDTTTLSTNDVLNRILDKKGDIGGDIYYTDGAPIWADSVPVPTVNPLDPNGWLYTNTNAGNTMNLYYFNGVNEIKTLSQVKGQYAVVTNLSTKLNNSLIFGIFTKSGSSFFTTRITHSPTNQVNMVAGSKYLLFWGDVDEYIYPTLPRLNFTDVITTGPANPSEEVLSVTLSSDSAAPAGDISISIESLGVVFDLEAREYNLLGSTTEYQTLVSIRNNTEDIRYKTNLLNFYNESGINELMTYDRASETNLIDIKNNTDKNKYTGDDLKTVISNTGFNVNNQITGFATETTLNSIKSNTNNLVGLSYSGVNLTNLNVNVADGNIAVTSIPNVTINNPSVNYSLESGGNLEDIKTASEAIKINSDKNKYYNDDLKVVFSNTGISVNTISGFSLETTAQTTNTKLDTINTSITNKTLNKTTSSIDISGQRVITDISGQMVDISGQRVDITGQTLNVNTISGFSTSVLQTTGNTLLSDIKTNTDKNKYVDDDLKTVISNTGFNCNNINNTPLITGYATQTTLSDIKTNTDKNKYVEDDLKAVISNTSFESKLRDGNNNIITSTVYGIDGVRGLDVSIKNATQAEPLIVEIPVTNVLTTTVNNFPASYPIDAGGALSSATGALYVNLRDTTGNPYGVSGAPLVVQNSNNITGYALETGGNLASIKTNTDKFKFTGDFLKTEVNASVTNPLIVEELNPITGFALETGGNLASIKTNTDKNTYDPSGNLKVNLASGSITVDSVNIKASNGDSLTATGTSLNTNITNTSIDTHCYASSNGTAWHHLSSDSNGQLNIHSKTQDGVGTDITSTLVGAKQSLDVNVANSVAVTGSFYPATQPVSGSVSITGDVNLTEDNRVLLGTNNIVGGIATLTSVNPAYTEAGVRALHTLNYNHVYNNDVGIYLPLTSKSIGGTYALNCFNIPAETKQYSFGGIDNNPTAYRLIGGNASSSGLPIDLYNFGLPNARTYWASLSAGTPSTLMYIDYINSSGDLVEDNVNAYTLIGTDTSSNWTLLPSMIGPPIKFRTSTAIGDTVNTGYGLYISPVTNRNRSICHSSIANYGIGVFTIPNGYIGYITSIIAGYATAGSIIMVKWDVNGVRQVVHKLNTENALAITVSAGYEGTLGGIFVAGESIAFTNNLTTAGKLVQASITLRKI